MLIFRLMDQNAGPMALLDYWRHQHQILIDMTHQLKGTEYTSVICILIQAKSTLLKKWKVADAMYVSYSFVMLVLCVCYVC